ncbi:hypothetical protein ACLOJK_025141 [Asimina triloba]
MALLEFADAAETEVGETPSQGILGSLQTHKLSSAVFDSSFSGFPLLRGFTAFIGNASLKEYFLKPDSGKLVILLVPWQSSFAFGIFNCSRGPRESPTSESLVDPVERLFLAGIRGRD